MSARQIADAIDEDFSSVCKCLRRLLRFNEIQFIELDRYVSCQLLGDNYVSRRMRFFFSIDISESQIVQGLDLRLADLHSQ